ncbi:polyketide cyclase / dehydrase and lipid transport [Jiangella asiatica]|uniref:Polyketide cyclase / dehydrase and lipid transport n=1 Tax=Jiangella asiatica TaxID=2530372 RepID=A0A4R5CF10_9ACTN|nr:polyketide cyclase / dehydrase and lipid transport [Jiangella asiatica]TDD96873.1 polyketide cyclase / dehydrase and lipid transport [Jiangella asiatica]
MTPSIDLMDDTFVVAARTELATYFRDPQVWRAWWPALRLAVAQDRGLEGVRWTVAGELTGTAEIWLERWRDGAVVHWFLRAEPSTSVASPGRLRHRYTREYKARVHELKDLLEHGRPAGAPRLPAAR